jgi:hypothetical protein
MEDLDLLLSKFIPSFNAQERIAFFVGDPVTSMSPPPSVLKTLLVALLEITPVRRECTIEGRLSELSDGTLILPLMHASTTII